MHLFPVTLIFTVAISILPALVSATDFKLSCDYRRASYDDATRTYTVVCHGVAIPKKSYRTSIDLSQCLTNDDGNLRSLVNGKFHASTGECTLVKTKADSQIILACFDIRQRVGTPKLYQVLDLNSFLRNSDGQLTCGGVAFRGTKEEVFDYKFAPPDAIRGIGHRK